MQLFAHHSRRAPGRARDTSAPARPARSASAVGAQARGAVAACSAAKSPNTAAATTNLAAAQNDAAAGRYMNVRVEARAAVNLCASASR